MKKVFFGLLLLMMVVLLTACGSAGMNNHEMGASDSQSGMSAEPAAKLNGLEIYSPMAMAGKTGETTGAFMTIKNTGSAADQLVGAACEAAMMTQVHETVMDGDVMKMREVEAIEIPAGESVALKHGGYHIMLMDLMKDVQAGEMTNCTLKFATAGEVTVSMMVMSR